MTYVQHTLVPQQQVVMTTNVFLAYIKMRRDILGSDFDDRLTAILILLGTREVRSRMGLAMEPMTMTRLKELIAKQLNVTDRTAADDIRKLLQQNLVSETPLEGDRRVKVMTLTDIGIALYEQFGRESAKIILEASKSFSEYMPSGSDSSSPPKSIFYRDFARNMRQTSLGLAVAIGLIAGIFGSASPAKADIDKFFDEGLKDVLVENYAAETPLKAEYFITSMDISGNNFQKTNGIFDVKPSTYIDTTFIDYQSVKSAAMDQLNSIK